MHPTPVKAEFAAAVFAVTSGTIEMAKLHPTDGEIAAGLFLLAKRIPHQKRRGL
jgi:hypothetical protein